jgi:hypothetical protein
VYFGIESSTGTGIIGTGAAFGMVLSTALTNPLCFGTNSTERMRIDSSGNLLVGTTTTTANGGVVQVSNGITFPATQVACSNANTLDDYEEGTWTPTVSTFTGATFTYGAITGGTYIKVGRWMYLMAVMTVASKSGGSAGDAVMINIPIPAGAADILGISGVGYHISATTCTNLTVPAGFSGFPQGGVCTQNTTNFFPYWTNGATNRVLQLGDIASGFQVQFSIGVFTST